MLRFGRASALLFLQLARGSWVSSSWCVERLLTLLRQLQGLTPVIGIEVHAQLQAPATKLFSRAPGESDSAWDAALVALRPGCEQGPWAVEIPAPTKRWHLSMLLYRGPCRV